MQSFKDFQTSKPDKLILEMPHIPLEHGDPIDLELEVHSHMNPDDYIDYFKKFLQGEKVKTKTGAVQQLPKSARKEFADALLNQWDYTRLFTLKHYGDNVWKEIEKMLRKFL